MGAGKKEEKCWEKVETLLGVNGRRELGREGMWDQEGAEMEKFGGSGRRTCYWCLQSRNGVARIVGGWGDEEMVEEVLAVRWSGEG